jgi:hypothetical protein
MTRVGRWVAGQGSSTDIELDSHAPVIVPRAEAKRPLGGVVRQSSPSPLQHSVELIVTGERRPVDVSIGCRNQSEYMATDGEGSSARHLAGWSSSRATSPEWPQ